MDPGTIYSKEEIKEAFKIIGSDIGSENKYSREDAKRASEILGNIHAFEHTPREKTCRVCGETKSRYKFWRSKVHLDQRDSVCAECRIKIRKEKKMAKQAISKEKKVMTKVCSCCGRELPLSEFYAREASKDGYNGQCRDCMREKSRKYSAKLRKKKLEVKKIKESMAKKTKPVKPHIIIDKTGMQNTGVPSIAGVSVLPVDWSKIDDTMIFNELGKRGYYGQLKMKRVETFNIGQSV